VALGLHACGNATDYVIEQAARGGAAFLVCPCCIGKLRFGMAGGSSFSATQRDLPSLAPTQHAGAAGDGAGGEAAATAGAAEAAAAAPPAAAEQLPALTHPRSRWMADALRAAAASSGLGSSDDAFAAIAAAADVSHGEAAAAAAAAAGFDEAGHGRVARVCKLNIEVDRAQGAREAGFAVATLKLLQAEATAKNDLIVGAPRAARPHWAAVVDALAEGGR
jgi:hypothetical protein